jgi:carboxymethylenebutenolidase
MERKKASDYPREVLDLFDGYVHGRVTRREFLDRAARYAVGGVTALDLLESLSPNFAWAEQVKKDDPRIKAQGVEYPSPKGSGTMKGYLAQPAAGGKHPGVVVIHENRGLSPYIEDVARRLATEGYVALAPDALTPVGGYPADESKARDLWAKLDQAKIVEDLLSAYDALKARPECNGRVGAVGFCFGGGVVDIMATRFPDLAAGVAYYGPPPSAEDTARIKAPLLLHFAGNDKYIGPRWPTWEAALKANHVRYEAYIYPNTEHGFHNDTTPRYDEAAAKLSWSRTLAFFKANLGG